MKVLAIDPGDEHTGWALWSEGEGVSAGEVDSGRAVEWVQEKLQGVGVDVVVIEKYVLYPGKAGVQSWQPMLTSELIGGLKVIAEEKGARVEEQGAFIKVPMRKQLRARGIKLKGIGGHARDAELHLYHYLIKGSAMTNQRKLCL